MISFKDMMDSEPKEDGMPEMKSLSPKAKEEVKGLLEKAKMLLSKHGVEEPGEWIQNYCDNMGMDHDMEEDDMPESEGESEDKGKRGKLIMAILEKKPKSE
jgi:hypothetical protein